MVKYEAIHFDGEALLLDMVKAATSGVLLDTRNTGRILFLSKALDTQRHM